jgi:hypothetical protein
MTMNYGYDAEMLRNGPVEDPNLRFRAPAAVAVTA